MPHEPRSADGPNASRAPYTSRRGVLLGGAAAAGTGVLVAPGPAEAALPLVRPRSSASVLEAFGVNARPNFLTSGYRFYQQWMGALAAMGATSFRGLYAPGLPRTLEVVEEARRLGLSWDMVVVTDRRAPASEIKQTLRHIARHAADVCRSVKGLNEPNYERGRGPVTGDWETDTIRVQRVIWNTVRDDRRLSHVTVVGPTLQDNTAVRADYQRLANRGLLRVMDVGAIHRYPGGTYPDHLMDDRLSMLKQTWPGKRIWIGETGYTNAVDGTGGQRAVPEWVAAAYGPSLLLEAVDRRCHTALFEMLDDPDPGPKDVGEANFGLLATREGDGPPWRAKPIVAALRTLLTSLADPGPGYRPDRIRFRATGPGDLRTTLTAKRDGSVTAHLRRARDCYDPVRERAIAVPKARITIETPGRTRVVEIDHRVTSIRL